MKTAFCTLGCKVNQYETEAMREIFRRAGYSFAKKDEIPDVFVLNSCTVTAESDRKTRQTLRQIRRKYPNAVTVLCGCMAQAFPEKAEALADADIVFGNTDHSVLPELVGEYLKTKKRKIAVEPHSRDEKYVTPGICRFSGRTRACMKIEDGCNRFCSYCEIPYARGRVRSRAIADIFEEAKRLGDNGYREIVLVGINLSAYGSDLQDGTNICDAVEAVCSAEGIERVRLGSLEPDHMTDEMLSRLSAQKKFCPQFHLSLQSGCDTTLKRMNRHYNSEFYFDLITRIRKIFDNPSITTDIMVGFPGETDLEFSQSLAFAEKCKFAKAHVFTYSRREDTAADKLDGHLQKSVKHSRTVKMLQCAEKSHGEFLSSQIGKTENVLFETLHDGMLEGYTENYTRVTAKGSADYTGKIAKVYLSAAEDDGIFGIIV